MVSKDDPGSRILQAFRAGARGYLLEASAPAEFADAVRAVAAGGRYLGAGAIDRLLDSLRSSRSDLDALNRLNAMERQILRLVADGKSNSEAAAMLGLSPRTVETYRSGVMHKLGLADVSSLVKFALRQGIIGID
jgi:DNA-binding NarL/FixJ family response regulator